MQITNTTLICPSMCFQEPCALLARNTSGQTFSSRVTNERWCIMQTAQNSLIYAVIPAKLTTNIWPSQGGVAANSSGDGELGRAHVVHGTRVRTCRQWSSIVCRTGGKAFMPHRLREECGHVCSYSQQDGLWSVAKMFLFGNFTLSAHVLPEDGLHQLAFGLRA